MTKMNDRPEHAAKIYAGVLGKIIGVYLGRPVEGWPYEQIRSRFGEVNRFVHADLRLPLIVADDDLSGCFGFFRALADQGYRRDIGAADFGDAWLNAIIEDRTILWWGGFGRSSEHTAYLRLKAGQRAPLSGSIALNGEMLATQIGAQIFTDAFALMSPGDPEQASALIRAAASVSHDGIALDCAAHLGALQALAFTEHSLDALFAAAAPYVRNDELRQLIDDVRALCARERDWRRARDWLQQHHGYGVHLGPCPIQTNHAAVLLALLLGGDDFARSLSIAASAGWDTDCNAGSVGCLNGVRLGLGAIPSDWRDEVADRLLVVTAEGGSCLRDALLETRDILRARAAFAGEGAARAEMPRFAFELPGARQGFAPCPRAPADDGNIQVQGQDDPGLCLRLDLAAGQRARVSTAVFLDFDELVDHFGTHASPTLYATQEVQFGIHAPQRLAGESLSLRPYTLYYDAADEVQTLFGDEQTLRPGTNEWRWRIPKNGGMPLFRLGLEFRAERSLACELCLQSVDWRGAPADFQQQGMLMSSIWNLQPRWSRAWVSAAKEFAPDFSETYCVSHSGQDGLVTMGTRDWRDYAVESRLRFSLHEVGGLVLRARGLRRYYAALFCGGDRLAIVAQQDAERHILAECTFAYRKEHPYALRFAALGERLTLLVDGRLLLEAQDGRYDGGGAGFLIERGTMLADGFLVQSLR